MKQSIRRAWTSTPEPARYKPGTKYETTTELCLDILAGKTVWAWGGPRNAAMMRNQQLHTLSCLVQAGSVRKATK
jgi:hypothetical protein